MNMLTGASGGFCEKDLNFLRVFKTLKLWLQKDVLPCFNSDISLLSLVIKVACDGIAHKDSGEWYTENKGKLEYNLTLLKNKRNEMAHNVRPLRKDEMKKNIIEFRSLIVLIIKLASTRFGISCTEKDKIISELNDSLNRNRDQRLLEAEIVEYRKKIYMDHTLYIIKSKGPEELREKYKCLTVINPVSFIDGYDMRVEVDAIYSKLKIIESGRHSNGDVIEIDDLL
ncbi:hypothetical protein Pmani_006314 [Petrolisthes manimaculis]|uniref:Uncharacterized protein n=1 Tax=Petrolisthes manimaculis TaxID=1843537 RepID=A0AAE1QC01_9EUCA|nr:hypothetical protein Pmani_006314 [Petrolisthes manimaculis]